MLESDVEKKIENRITLFNFCPFNTIYLDYIINMRNNKENWFYCIPHLHKILLPFLI